MRSRLPSLPDNLYKSCYEALLSCDEFESDSRLRAVFEKGDLATYQRWFLEREFNTKEERVKITIAYLIRQRLQGVRPVFPMFLIALRNSLVEGDGLRDELENLGEEVERELTSVAVIRTAPLVDTYTEVSLKIPEMEEVLLNPSDRARLISIVITAIEHMSADGMKDLLRGCLPEAWINYINFNNGSRSIAETMVGKLVQRDKGHRPHFSALEAFLNKLREEASLQETEAGEFLKGLLIRYNHAWSGAQCSHNDRPAEAVDTFESPSHLEERNIQTRLYQERSQAQVSRMSPRYKIDASMIIHYNLDPQTALFRAGFNGRYRGSFFSLLPALTVAF